VCCGLHTKHFEGIGEYNRARDSCMEHLFSVIASAHSLSEEDVRRSLGHRRILPDLLVILSFALIYAFVASLFARWLCYIYGPSEALLTIAVMTILVSLLVSVAATMFGDAWSWSWESVRLANGHMSYRGRRIPSTQHLLGLFVGSELLFLVIAVFYRVRAMKVYARVQKRSNPETNGVTGGVY
jgi:hypothetical protein